MTLEGRLLRTLGTHFEKRIHNTTPEQGTVISIEPLVIQLDFDLKIQLRFDDGDFVVNDILILSVGDRVILSELGSGNQYVVLCRIRGLLDEAVVGGPDAKQVARVGDPITLDVVLGTSSVGDHGAHTHVVTVTGKIIESSTSKVKVD